jgi:uncharacterized protein YbjT (DUF2867 family)
MQKIKNITIFGGTGFLGRYVVKELAKLGYKINVLSRFPEDSQYLKTAASVGQIKFFRGNIFNKELIEKLVKDSDVVINLVGILYEKKKGDFIKYHAEFPGLISKLAAENNIKKLIHISALGVDKNVMSKYALSKFQGEELVKSNYKEAIILRPSIVFGCEDNFFNKFARMAQFSPFLPLIMGGKTKFQPVYVNDIAIAIKKIIQSDDIKMLTYEIAGPDVLDFKELLQLCLLYCGKKRLFVNLPKNLALFMAWFLEKFPNPQLTRDQVKMLINDNVTNQGSLTFFDLQIQPKNIEEIIPKYLGIYKNSCNYKD